MAVFKIDEFVADIGKWGLASPNKYEVSFGLPPGANNSNALYPSAATKTQLQILGTPNNAKSIAMRCTNMTFPGRGIQTLDDLEFGATKKVPFTTDYNAAEFSFISSRDLFERVFFEAWQSLVLNPVSNTVNFWDDYTSDITMSQLNNETEEETYSIRLKDAYPISVNAMDYGYDKTNEVQIITVSLIYKYWVNLIPLEQDVYNV